MVRILYNMLNKLLVTYNKILNSYTKSLKKFKIGDIVIYEGQLYEIVNKEYDYLLIVDIRKRPFESREVLLNFEEVIKIKNKKLMKLLYGKSGRFKDK